MAYASNDGVPTQLFTRDNTYGFGVERLSSENVFRSFQDDGKLNYLGYNPNEGISFAIEIGNLPDGIRLALTPNQQAVNPSLDFGKLAQDLFTSGPVGVGERIGETTLGRRFAAETLNILAGGGGRAGGVARTVFTESLSKLPGYFQTIGKGIGLGNVAIDQFKPYFDPDTNLTINDRQTISSFRGLRAGISFLAGAAVVALIPESAPVAVVVGIGVVAKIGIDEALKRLEKYILSLVRIKSTDGF